MIKKLTLLPVAIVIGTAAAAISVVVLTVDLVGTFTWRRY
jgi:hypothetical protein